MSLQLWDDEAEVRCRLGSLGISGIAGVRLHENRTVMVSVTDRGILRLHRGFVYASDRVLRAVVAFVNGGGRVRRAERTVLEFPVDQFVPPPNGAEPRPAEADRSIVGELDRRHGLLNQAHFGGRLSPIRFNVSPRMRTRLGDLTLDSRTGQPTRITVSRRHVFRDGWDEVEHTLLHEMVHQWQAEKGLPVDHGSTFRAKAREVGITPHACREVRPAAHAGETVETLPAER